MRIARPRSPLRLRRRVVVAAVTVLAGLVSAACVVEPTLYDVADAEDLDVGAPSVAYAWLGVYEGWGSVRSESGTRRYDNLTLTIALDADSARVSGCEPCVTIRLDDWFYRANLRLEAAVDAYFRYEEMGVERSLAASRFSEGGRTGNALLVKLLVQRRSGAGHVTILDGDLEFQRR